MAHSSTASGSFSDIGSDNDIEMTTLEDVAMSPAFLRPQQYEEDGEDGSEDEPGHDEVDRALLDPSGERTHSSERRMTSHSMQSQILHLILETGPTLLLTTISLLFTGELLDEVSKWRAMSSVNELIIIIPVILNLKGNLEMNLSARLSTAANVGDLDEPATRNQIIFGNLSLLQLQAAVVSLVAANVSFLLAHFMPAAPAMQEDPFPDTPGPNSTATFVAHTLRYALRAPPTSYRPHPAVPVTPKFGFAEYIMVSATAMGATCLSSALLGSFMCTLVVICRKLGLDPDNIAPPIASCLGDLVTLSLVGLVSLGLIDFIATPLPLIVVLVIVAIGIGAAVLVRRNPHTRDLIFQGWSPLFGAMVISSATGIVLDVFVSRYRGFALLAIVISGLPGSAGSIFVSRMSTSLHAAEKSTHRQYDKRPEPSPRMVMLTLLLVTFPIELFFLGFVRLLGWVKLPILFMVFSVIFFCVAVTASLFIARTLTRFLWSHRLDPDMYAMPIHSASMDLIGQLLLVACFEIVQHLGKSVEVVPSGQ